jgi:hypothetical protein
MGGPETEVVSRHIRRLRSALGQHCLGPYSQSIRDFGLVFSVEGSLIKNDKQGVQGIRLYKSGTIICDIYVSEPEWKHKPADHIRCLLALYASEAVNAFAARIRKAKLDWQEDEFLSDTNAALEAFLAEEGEPELTEGDREFRQKLRLLVEHRQFEVAMGKPRSPIGRGILELLQSDPEGLPPGVHYEP